MKLSKILEGAWVRIAASRLSVPFFRPLLPIMDLSDETLQKSAVMTDSYPAIYQYSKELQQKIPDLLYILEKIHSLKYHKLTDFYLDLQIFENAMKSKLFLIWRYYTERVILEDISEDEKAAMKRLQELAKEPKKNIGALVDKEMQQKSYLRDLLLSFDTIYEAGYTFLESKKTLARLIEEEIDEENKQGSEKVGNHASSSSARSGRRRRTSGNKDKEKEEDGNTMNSPTASSTSSSTSQNAESAVEFTPDPMELMQFEQELEEKIMHMLLKSFRLECHYFPPLHRNFTKQAVQNHYLQSMTPDTVNGNEAISEGEKTKGLHFEIYDKELIFPRSLRNWSEYVQEGAMPTQDYCREYMSEEGSKTFHSLLSKDGLLDKQYQSKQIVNDLLAIHEEETFVEQAMVRILSFFFFLIKRI